MCFPCGKVYHKMGPDRTKCPCVGETTGTNFAGCSYWVDFTAFSYAMGNWWGNPCNSHIIKFTIGCKSYGKRVPMQWEKSQYQFPRFSTYDGFCRTFPGTNFPGFSHSMGFPVFSNAMRNWWEKSCLSHIRKYTTGWKSNEKTHLFYGKSMATNFPGLLHSVGFADFSNVMENLMRRPMHFPCDEAYHRMGI